MSTMNFTYAIVFVIGIMIGGFVNLCVDRFPKKVSLRKKGYCENCKAELAWHDMIPIVSFLLLKGRCRSCGAKVNIQYPLVELANGLLYVIVFMANGCSFRSTIYCLMTSAFLVISIVDERTQEIPLPCNVFIGGLGIILCVFEFPGWKNMLFRLIGMVIVFIVLYLFASIGMIGGGDVKLMTAATILLDWPAVAAAFLIACIVGSIIHVIRMKVSGKGRVLAMGPYLCLGLWICTFWGEALIHWYLGPLLK